MNAHLYSEKERTELARVVDTMLHYSLSFRQQLNAETMQYEYLFEP